MADNTTNDQDKLTAVNGSSQSFDNDGNTLVGVVPGTGSTGATATMTYNAWNEMTSADVGGTTENYKYNAWGQQITIIQGVATQEPYCSMSGQVIETDAGTTGELLSPQTQKDLKNDSDAMKLKGRINQWSSVDAPVPPMKTTDTDGNELTFDPRSNFNENLLMYLQGREVWDGRTFTPDP